MARIVEFPEPVRIDIQSPSELVEAIAERRTRVGGEPAMTDGEIARERVVGQDIGGRVIAHDAISEVRTMRVGIAGDEAVHLAAVDRLMDGVEAVRRIRKKNGVLCCERKRRAGVSHRDS